MAAVGALAGIGATIAQSRDGRRQLEILGEIGRVADGSAPLAVTMKRISDIIVPGIADICVIDGLNQGRVTRLATQTIDSLPNEAAKTLAARVPSVPSSIVNARATSRPEPRLMKTMSKRQLRAMAHDESDFTFLKSLDLNSSLTVPLIARGSVIGALTIARCGRRRGLRDRDLQFVETLSGRIALALDNAGLFTNLSSLSRRMDIVLDTLDDAIVVHDREGIPVFANRAAMFIFDVADLNELSSSPNNYLLERFRFYDEQGQQFEYERLPFAQAAAGDSPEPMTIRMISRSTNKEIWLHTKSKAVLGADNETLYAVTILEDVTEVQQQNFAQSLLAKTGQLLDSTNNYERTVNRLTEMAVPGLADWGGVYLVNGEELELVSLTHASGEMLDLAKSHMALRPPSLGDPLGPAEVVRSGRPIVIEHMTRVDTDDEFMARLAEVAEELDIGSAMMLPLRNDDRVIGVLGLANSRKRRRFTDFDLDLAEKLADRLAPAIDNSRQATEQAAIAETLQESLRPAPIPDIEGWSMATMYRPGGAENDVGGDFYGAYRLETGWMVVMGDVTGRGARAASITGLARHILQTASSLSSDPLISLRTLNRALLDRDDSSLCSLVVVALADGSHSIDVVVAGHPPPLRIAADGSVTRIPPTGPILGAFADADWRLTSLELEPYEQVLLYTDGATEAGQGSSRFGEERLSDVVKSAPDPATALRRIETALASFCLHGLDDDVAVLALQPNRQSDVAV